MTTFIPPGITRLEIQQIADQRDAALARVAELEARKLHVDAEATRICVERDRYREALEKIQKAEEASPTVTLLDFGEGLIALEDFLEDVLDPK